MTNQKMKQIYAKALEDNKTTDLALEEKKIKEIVKKIEALLKKSKISAKVRIGGSAAKDTFLGNDFDIDIFIIFDYKKYLEKDISTILGNAIKSLNPDPIMGSRNYFQVNKRYEIIPVLDIKNAKNLVNVTDASILHVGWVNKHLNKKPNLKNEIRLTKLFLKSIGVYGAESYIKGISGHVTDILVINYGSFENLLKAASKWKDKVEIDIEKHKTILDKSKMAGPLTVIDPIQPNRNAAAALSEEKFNKLKSSAIKFLKNPSAEFFKVKEIELKEIKKEYDLVLQAMPKKGKIDIVGAKLMKGYEFILGKLQPFGIKSSKWVWDKENTCYYCFKLSRTELDKEYEHKGPAKELPVHVKRFKEKYKNAYVVNGIWYAKVKRTVTKIVPFVNEILKDEYLKDKSTGIKII